MRPKSFYDLSPTSGNLKIKSFDLENIGGSHIVEHTTSQGQVVSVKVWHSFVPDMKTGGIIEHITFAVDGSAADHAGGQVMNGQRYYVVRKYGAKKGDPSFGIPESKVKEAREASRKASLAQMPEEWHVANRTDLTVGPDVPVRATGESGMSTGAFWKQRREALEAIDNRDTRRRETFAALMELEHPIVAALKQYQAEEEAARIERAWNL